MPRKIAKINNVYIFMWLYLLFTMWQICSHVHNTAWKFNVWISHIILVTACSLSGYFDFLPQFKGLHVRLSGDSKFTVSVKPSVSSCLTLCVNRPVDWQALHRLPASCHHELDKPSKKHQWHWNLKSTVVCFASKMCKSHSISFSYIGWSKNAVAVEVLIWITISQNCTWLNTALLLCC